jgi:hypothetical protein
MPAHMNVTIDVPVPVVGDNRPANTGFASLPPVRSNREGLPHG